MTKTTIEWADEVWNPVTGCTKVSQGCKNCYAERIASRFWGERKFTDVVCHEERLADPFRWKKPRRVFVNSMSDLFHEKVPYQFAAKVFFQMATNKKHTFIVLTKRPERMFEFCTSFLPAHWGEPVLHPHLPIENVWLGVSVEDQATADLRIPLLLKTPAAVRFVSCEPLLGSINLTKIRWAKIPVNPKDYERHGVPAPDEMWSLNNVLVSRPADQWNRKKVGLDWVIVGGESGPGARPFSEDWARRLKDQCVEADVPFFYKQGRHMNGQNIKMPVLDGQVWDQYPKEQQP